MYWKIQLLSFVFILFASLAQSVGDTGKSKVDLVFLVDASSTVDRQAVGSTKRNSAIVAAIKRFWEGLSIGEKKTRVALILFGGAQAEVVFNLNQFNGIDGMLNALSSKKFPSYSTRFTSGGFLNAKQQFQTFGRRDSDVGSVVVVLTDGEATDAAETDRTAQDLKDIGAIVITIGLGAKISKKTLDRWASRAEFSISAELNNIDEKVDEVQESLEKASKIASGKCVKRFPGAQHCWAFTEVDDNGETLDDYGNKVGVLGGGAKIENAAGRLCLVLKGGGAFVNLGDFAGTCTSDPELCTNGLTVMFWIKVTPAMLSKMLQAGNTHQYIISSGGQRKDSRGFAFLYQKDPTFVGYKLQLQTSSGDHVVELENIPSAWFLFTFTYSKAQGLVYYQNGMRVQKGTEMPGTYPNDAATNLTIGKPNRGDKFFASFLMDTCVIYYKSLAMGSIASIAGSKTAYGAGGAAGGTGGETGGTGGETGGTGGETGGTGGETGGTGGETGGTGGETGGTGGETGGTGGETGGTGGKAGGTGGPAKSSGGAAVGTSGETGGSVGEGGLASGVTNVAGQSGGAAANSAATALAGPGGSGSEIGASVGGGSDSASADISTAGAAALSDATGGSTSTSLGGPEGGSIGGGASIGPGGKASRHGSSAGGSVLGAGAEASERVGGDLANGASAGITAGAGADVGRAGGAAGVSDQNACGGGYPGVKYCYTFDSEITVRGEPTVIEAMGSSKNAVLKRGAFLDESGSITFLSLVGKPRSYVQLGNFIGECTSDPETCTSGLTVSFWLKIQTKDIDGNSEAHQYIISSGGQVGSARGFSFLYVKEESKFKLQLQTRSSVYMIELDSLPEKWFHFCFTYSAESGLTYYQDGVQRKASDPKSKEFEFDGHTNLTVGRPNHIDKHFGSFRMDQLAIFYKLLKPDGVKNIGRDEVPTGAPPVASDVGMASTAAPPVDGGQTTAGPTRALTQAPPLVTQPGSKPNLIPPTGKGGACQAKADIVLILDNSGSIEGRGHEGFFRKIIGFAKQFYRAFDVPASADVAIVEASTDAHLVFNLGEMKDIGSMDAAVDALIAKKQRSFIGRALELTRTQVLGPVMCNNKAKLVVVVTDGYTSDDVMLPSLEMRDSGVVILTVAFGEETPFVRYTSKLMASDPKNEHVFMLGYDELLQSVPDIASVACKDASDATTPENAMSDATTNVVGGVSLGFKILFLDEVNRYRHMHSAVPVMWSAELTIQAQRWAEYLASQEKLQHMPKVKIGQAMYISTKPGPISAQITVRAWYNQIMFYDFQKPAISTYNSYFVQMVWRSSTQVGVGKFTSPSNKTYVVAFFSPGALDDEILKYNVLPVTGSAVHGISIGYCPEGYQANGGYCYKLYSEPMSWVEAVATCNAQKSSLVSIARDEEYYFVTNMMHESTVTQIWIGLNDRVNEGSFTWVDGMPLSFNGWLSPPQIGGERDCVQFNVEKGWLDAVCNVRQAFICKTLMPGDVIFMVTIHYPSQPWSNELSYGSSAAATELMQRVERLVMDVYGTKEWFLSYNIKAFRGQVSVYIDMELRFAPTAPIDPLQPLKDVAYTESCEGFICDLSDVQLVPAINVTYNGTCTPSCYSTCTPTCDPGCCSPPSAPPLYAYPPPAQVTQIEPPGQAPLVVAVAAQIPPPVPAPAPPPLPPMPAINTDSFCLPICATRCVAACPKMCCSDLQKRHIMKP